MDDILNLMNLAQTLDCLSGTIEMLPSVDDKRRAMEVARKTLRLLDIETTRQVAAAEARAERDGVPVNRNGAPGPQRVSEG
jgi:hypothetical protein